MSEFGLGYLAELDRDFAEQGNRKERADSGYDLEKQVMGFPHLAFKNPTALTVPSKELGGLTPYQALYQIAEKAKQLNKEGKIGYHAFRRIKEIYRRITSYVKDKVLPYINKYEVPAQEQELQKKQQEIAEGSTALNEYKKTLGEIDKLASHYII